MKTKLILLTLALMALGTVGANAQTGLGNAMKKGTETKTKNDAEGAKMPAYKGVKHALGVTDFTNETGPASSTELGTNLRVMLESSLSESGRFAMVERGNLGSVIAEQDFQQSGRVAKSKTVAETGKVRGARYVATGAVTEVSGDTSGERGGLAVGPFKFGGGAAKSSVVLMVKLIDTTSGEIVASKRIRGEAGKARLGFRFDNGRVAAGMEGFARTPMGEAAQACIDAAVVFITEAMQRKEVESTVLRVIKNEVVIALGATNGIEVGMTLLVRKDGEILRDPDDGAILDRLEGEVTGTIEVVRVREKSAYCKVIEGKLPVEKDRVVLESNS